MIRIYWKLDGEPDSIYAFLTDINDGTELHHERTPGTTYRYKLVLLHPVYGENIPVWKVWPGPIYATATTPEELEEAFGLYVQAGYVNNLFVN